MQKKLNIIHAHATRFNVGDDAIVIATHNLLTETLGNNYEITDITLDKLIRKDEPITSFLPLYKLFTLKYIFPYIKTVYKCDVVLIGGGELIAGGCELLGLATFASILRKPVFFFGLGVNMQGKSRLDILYAKFTLRFVNKFMVRDISAQDELLSLGVPKSKIKFCNDIVFSLQHNSQVNQKNPSNKKLIGISLREQESSNRQFGKPQLIKIADILSQLSDKIDVEFIFYPFLINDGNTSEVNAVKPDTLIIDECIALMKESTISRVYSGDLHPTAVMESLSKLDILFAMRLHANILGLISGTKIIPISYAPKIERVLNSVDTNIPMLHLNKEIDVGSTMDLIINHLNTQTNYSEQLNEIRRVSKENILSLELNKIEKKHTPIWSLILAIPFLFTQQLIQLYYKL